MPINVAMNKDINIARIFESVSLKERYYELKGNPPTESFLVAACVMAGYKSAEYWTSIDIDEVCAPKPVYSIICLIFFV